MVTYSIRAPGRAQARPLGEANSEVVHIRVPDELWRAIDDCAQDERRTWAQMARLLLEDALDARQAQRRTMRR